MEAHAHDLRSEASSTMGEAAAVAWVARIQADWRTAGLSAADHALCVFAERLTRAPAETGAREVEALRAAGFDDRAIHDAAQVVAYFNYINRVAEALGTEPEAFFPPRPARGPR